MFPCLMALCFPFFSVISIYYVVLRRAVLFALLLRWNAKKNMSARHKPIINETSFDNIIDLCRDNRCSRSANRQLILLTNLVGDDLFAYLS